MSAQLNRRNPSSRRPVPRDANPVYETRQCDTERIRLLKALTVEADAMWKAQAFDFARDQLRGKMNDDVTVDTVIAVVGEHFPMPTITAEQEARRVVNLFRNSFGNVRFLTPSVFLNREGNDQTGNIYKSPRPANVCHLGVKARIPMGELSDAFDESIADFNLSYFLELPQSFAADSITTPSYSSTLSSSHQTSASLTSRVGIDNFDANIFSPKKKMRYAAVVPTNINFSAAKNSTSDTNTMSSTSNDGGHANTAPPQNIFAAPVNGNHIRFDTDGNSLHSNHQNSSEKNNSGETKSNDENINGLDDIGVVEKISDEPNNNSQSSWQFDKNYASNPKVATLIQERKNSQSMDSKSVYTFHGHLGILDNQHTSDSEIEDWSEIYELDTRITGKPTVINKLSIEDKLKSVSGVIQFRVFCHAYREAYVGKDGSTDEAEGLIIASVHKSLRVISMRYRDPASGEYKNSTPDAVYRKMHQHIALLPEDASQWPFCLPWLFYNALTYRLQSQLQKEKYSLPNPVSLSTKTLQIKSMTECRDKSRLCHKAIKEIRYEIMSMMTPNHFKASMNVNNVHNDNDFPPFDDADEDYPYDDNANSFRFNPQSRAGETIAREQREKALRGLFLMVGCRSSMLLVMIDFLCILTALVDTLSFL